MRRYFITGTDTNVGKTIASALLINYFHKFYKYINYYKAIQTGALQDCDATTVKKLCPQSSTIKTIRGLAFKRPLSPHLAAFYENTTININNIIKNIHDNCDADLNIIEGAGGLLVPLNDRFLIIDLIKKLDIPVILIARSGLGTINHTLLSLKILRDYNITISALCMVGPRNRDNEESIRFFGRLKNIISIPVIAPLGQSSLETLGCDLADKLTILR